MASILVFAVYRLLTALPVLRWPFVGALIAILGDLGDLFLLYFIGREWDYQALDKHFDLFYMTTFLAVALRWKDPARAVAAGLFAFRMIGFIAFEVTQWRPVLILFPNVFEFWFVAVAGIHRFQPQYRFTPRRVIAVLAAATVAKLGQEYALHVERWFDDFTIMDLLRDVWTAITPF